MTYRNVNLAIGLEALFVICRRQLAPQGIILSRPEFAGVPGVPLVLPSAVIELAQVGLAVAGFQMVIQLAPAPRKIVASERN